MYKALACDGHSAAWLVLLMLACAVELKYSCCYLAHLTCASNCLAFCLLQLST